MGLGSDLLRKSFFWRKPSGAADHRASSKSDSEAVVTSLREEEEEQEEEQQADQRMDVFYISHGSPKLPLQDCPARDFLLQWHKTLPQKPKSILIISAHWNTNEPAVNTVAQNSTIHDFYGFPPELYKMQYNPPGAPGLAGRVKQLLLESGVRTVHEDARRGLDHGAWVPLCLMYAKADIPVCQLSVQPNKDAAYHYRLGQALAPLREEGVLIIGSGSATHNLRTLRLDGSGPPSWALAFDDWLHQSLASGRFEDVINYEDKAPHAKRVHPSPEHFYPLHVALGAAGSRCRAQRIHTSWMASSLSMANFAFT